MILGGLAPAVVVADHHETASSTDAADAYLRALEGGSLPPPKTTVPPANTPASAARQAEPTSIRKAEMVEQSANDTVDRTNVTNVTSIP